MGDEATDAAEIDAKLLSVRKESGTLRVVTGRGVQRGDTVICDFDAGGRRALVMFGRLLLPVAARV